MPPLILVMIVIVIALLFLIIRNARSLADSTAKRTTAGRREGTDKFTYKGTPPDGIGLRSEVPLHDVVMRLEQAFAEGDFAERIKYRVLQRNPRMSAAEYDWHFVELKRFFVLSAVMKSAPMFSSRVDDIWHEMLLFTREYQQFCDQFIGFQVHHAPHAEVSPMPEDRAWFDWVYAQLFVPYTYSSRIWRGFFQGPLGTNHIQELERLEPEQVKERFFNARSAEMHQEVQWTVDMLIREVKRQIKQAQQNKVSMLHNHSLDARGRTEGFAGLDFSSIAGAMILFSILEPDDYHQQMNEMLEEQKRAAAQSADLGTGSEAYFVDSGSEYSDYGSRDDTSDYEDGGNDSDSGSDAGWNGGDSDGGGSGGSGSGSSGSDGGNSGSSGCSSGCSSS